MRASPRRCGGDLRLEPCELERPIRWARSRTRAGRARGRPSAARLASDTVGMLTRSTGPACASVTEQCVERASPVGAEVDVVVRSVHSARHPEDRHPEDARRRVLTSPPRAGASRPSSVRYATAGSAVADHGVGSDAVATADPAARRRRDRPTVGGSVPPPRTRTHPCLARWSQPARDLVDASLGKKNAFTVSMYVMSSTRRAPGDGERPAYSDWRRRLPESGMVEGTTRPWWRRRNAPSDQPRARGVTREIEHES